MGRSVERIVLEGKVTFSLFLSLSFVPVISDGYAEIIFESRVYKCVYRLDFY